MIKNSEIKSVAEFRELVKSGVTGPFFNVWHHGSIFKLEKVSIDDHADSGCCTFTRLPNLFHSEKDGTRPYPGNEIHHVWWTQLIGSHDPRGRLFRNMWDALAYSVKIRGIND